MRQAPLRLQEEAHTSGGSGARMKMLVYGQRLTKGCVLMDVTVVHCPIKEPSLLLKLEKTAITVVENRGHGRVDVLWSSLVVDEHNSATADDGFCFPDQINLGVDRSGKANPCIEAKRTKGADFRKRGADSLELFVDQRL
jgi:hypothetical protein